MRKIIYLALSISMLSMPVKAQNDNLSNKEESSASVQKKESNVNVHKHHEQGRGKSEAPKIDGQLSADGPYIVYDSLGTGATITKVDVKGNIETKHYDFLKTDQKFKVTTSDGSHTFEVQLHYVERPKWNYAEPKRLFVTSDPHADFDCLYNLLTENGVIDKECNWTYGDGHLALLGDVMDRGKDVLPIYWLLYKLESQAAKAGGAVHFVIGNHEPIVLSDDNRYTDEKYTTLAYKMGVKYSSLFSPRTELGRWLLSHNTIELVGKNLLVHAGLSRELFDKNLSIPEINALVPIGLYQRKKDRKESGRLVSFLSATNGPIWYRGLVKKNDSNPVSSDTLNLILQRYGADRIIVGHTIHKEVSSFYEGRVIGVNVENAKNRKENRTRALLIENGNIYVVRNNAVREELK